MSLSRHVRRYRRRRAERRTGWLRFRHAKPWANRRERLAAKRRVIEEALS